MRMPQKRVRNCEIRLYDCRLFKPSVQKGRQMRLMSRKKKVISAPVASCPGPSGGRNTRKLCRVCVCAVSSADCRHLSDRCRRHTARMDRDVKQDTVRHCEEPKKRSKTHKQSRRGGGARRQEKGDQ
jgi:hypothetical protein